MVDLNNGYDPNAEPYSSVSSGEHIAEIIESKMEPVSKNKDIGNCLILTWKIKDGPDNGSLIWQRLSLYYNGDNAQKVVGIANSQFAEVRRATGVPTPRDSTELHNRPCVIVVGAQKNNPEYQEVKRVKPLPQRNSAATGVSTASPANQAPAHGTGDPWGRPAA